LLGGDGDYLVNTIPHLAGACECERERVGENSPTITHTYRMHAQIPKPTAQNNTKKAHTIITHIFHLVILLVTILT